MLFNSRFSGTFGGNFSSTYSVVSPVASESGTTHSLRQTLLTVKWNIPMSVVGLQVSIIGLERALHQYTLEPAEKPFDLKSVPLATQPLAEQKTGLSSHALLPAHSQVECLLMYCLFNQLA